MTGMIKFSSFQGVYKGTGRYAAPCVRLSCASVGFPVQNGIGLSLPEEISRQA